MTPASTIGISLDLAGDRIAGVRIAPRALPPVGRLVQGRPAAQLVMLMPRLFTLCAAAHGAAAQAAVDAALGLEAPPELQRRRAAAVVAERLVEQLRVVLIAQRLLEQPPVAQAMRELMAAATGFSVARNAAGSDLRDAIGRIERALQRIGLAQQKIDDAAAVRFGESGERALGQADDGAIIDRLRSDGARYAGLPDLDGAVPETGPWARARMAGVTSGPATVAARLRARIAEIARLPQALRDLAGGGPTSLETIIANYRLGDGVGAAAVETARGRLYHYVELDAESRVSRFQCLAPTEWNFHPEGPLARMLRHAVVVRAADSLRAIEQLVAAFDPCVSYKVTVREVADA